MTSAKIPTSVRFMNFGIPSHRSVYWYSRKSHKPFETDEKLKVAKQATSKTSFLPYQAQSSVLW